MRRYGSDYGRWAEPRPYDRGDWGAYGRGGEVGGRGYGWSRPDFNVSLGAYGRRPAEGEWARRRYEGPGGSRRFEGPAAWRTGEPWGRGASAANQTLAREIMTRDPEAVTPDTSLADVAARMRDLDVGIIPVVADAENRRLQGVITDRDIAVRAAAEGKDMKKSKAEDFMSTEVDSVREGDTVRDVFTVMKRRRVRRVPVTDEGGRLVGIIAQADLAVDYAGLDLDRETEVEEVLERISEPAEPQRGGWSGPYDRGWRDDYRGWREEIASRLSSGPQHDFTDRIRERWHGLRRDAERFFDRGYDRPFR